MKKLLAFIMTITMCVSTMPYSAFAIAANNNNLIEVVGDLDKDGEITDWDGVLLARHLAGWGGIFDSMVMDVDGDGEITDWDGVIFDRMLAGWSVNTEVGKKLAFNITYLNTKGAAHSNPATLQYGNTETALSEISVTHYAFDGWYEGNQKFTSIPANYNKDLSLTAKWTPIEYSITYNNTKGAVNTNPTHYNIENSTIALSNINVEGYTFDGWYNEGTRITSIPSGTNGNIVLTAKWTPCEYNIIYNNTKGATNNNATGFNTDSETIILSDLHKEGYDFEGWYQNDVKVTEITKGTIGDIELTAKWTPIEYSITYNNTKESNNTNPINYNIESATIILSYLNADGYVFDGWHDGTQMVTSIPSGTNGNIVLTAKWTPCEYNIIYNNTKGATNNNATGFNTDSETIILSDLHKEGYDFEGWYQNDVKVTEITKGTIGDIELIAKWTPITYSAVFVAEGNVVATRYFTIEDSVLDNVPNVPSKIGYTGVWQSYTIIASNITIYADYALNEYTITYSNTKGAENANPLTYSITTGAFTLSHLQCEGYTFDGWYKGNTKIDKIENGSYGNITLTAKWTPIEYSITYSDIKDAVNTNPIQYNVETGTIYLKNITTEHYIFDGWWFNGNKILSIPAGNIGNIEIVARWTPVMYDIIYQNTKGVANNNPVSYTAEDRIVLQEIFIEGYIFDGWYIGEEKVDSIEVGSSGTKVLRAHWTPITYSITYKNTKNSENSNVQQYTIESDVIWLSNLSETGYVFNGWESNGVIVDKIERGTFGDIELIAQWTPIIYNLYYQDTKGVTNQNPTSYTIEDQIILHDIYADGYIFDGWYYDGEKINTIGFGNYEDKEIYAKWTPKEYNITFEDTKNAVNNNPTSYNIESDTIKLESLSKKGYEFIGWYNGEEAITEIISGSKGNIVLTAKWKLINYTITYTASSYADILSHKNPTTYNIESSFDLTDTTIHSSYVFGGWYKDGVKITSITPGMTGDITLKASLTFTGTTITTKAGFEAIAYNPAGAYRLGANITITASICSSSTPFYGHFYGNGYTITGATPFAQNIGYIARVNVVGGGISNYNRGRIYRCSAKGYAKYNNNTGGIVGYNTGTVSQCYHLTNFANSPSFSGRYAGGIVGQNLGTVEDCYHNGSITPSSGSTIYYCGGIVGYNYTDGTINRCYATGYIKNIYAELSGGIVGLSNGLKISNCISTCTYDESFAFGIAGSSGGTFVNNYHSEPAVSTYYSTSIDAANLKSPTFITGRLYWSTDIWRLVNGKEPVLAWQ